MTEAEFLAQQATDAKRAMERALADLKVRLAHGADPRLWAQDYPWMTLGAAAVAGFLTATTLVPSKEEQALKKLTAIERALREPARASEDHPTNGKDKPNAKGLVATVLLELLGVLKPVVASILAGAVQAHTAGAPVDPSMQPDPAATGSTAP